MAFSYVSIPDPAKLRSRHIKHLRVVTTRIKLLALLPSNGIAAEAGVDEGNYSENILTLNRPKRLHLIDSWSSERFGEDKFNKIQSRFRAEVESGQVVINRGVSYDELGKFPDAYLDWVYLDTSHAYEDTAKELEVSRLKVKADGLIAGHDYTTGNIRRGLRYGVIQAVNEFCLKYDWEMIYLTHEPSRYLSYVIRRMKRSAE
jgi:hypothetical protein